MDTKWIISEEVRERHIDGLTDELSVLRAKIGISQDELARIIGVSRQTYGSIERRTRRMSWNTYLSLLFFFDNNSATHDTLRSLPAFPSEMIKTFNGAGSDDSIDLASFAGINVDNIKNVLDTQAMQTIRTVIMLEYARCANMPGDAVVKSFNGRSFTVTSSSDEDVMRSLGNIRAKKRRGRSSVK